MDRGKQSAAKGESQEQKDRQGQLPGITLPKGGGSIKGIGEKFSVSSLTGTSSISVPISVTSGRSGFSPNLSLTYDSGGGNGIFGLGWILSLPSISRKTEKALPRYQDETDSDTFLLSNAEDLIPVAGTSPLTVDTQDGEYLVRRYRPRIEGAFNRIERWQHKSSRDIFWKTISKENVTSVFGRSTKSRISDPDDTGRVFQWLLDEMVDDKGNVIVIEYKQENTEQVDPSSPSERNRNAHANRYVKRIKYGNLKPFEHDHWLFQVVFDYGEHNLDNPKLEDEQPWICRKDAFSSYRAGFEVRTSRLCRRVLMFHQFQELGSEPCLVRSENFVYQEGSTVSLLTSVIHKGYVKDHGTGNYLTRALPPLEFTYQEPEYDQTIHLISPHSVENLPIGLDTRQYRWVDLDQEGISGILAEQANAWFYKKNKGNGQFGPMELVATKPSIAQMEKGKQQLMDLGGDQKQYLVQFSGVTPGYQKQLDVGEWGPFTPFQSQPQIPWDDPNLRFIDLTGDGNADVLITDQDQFIFYPSLGVEGFGTPTIIESWSDEENGPTLVFSDITQSIFLADFSGDGLTDLVRIRQGEVCYWPNMGYGKFGKKITMDHSPLFCHADLFTPERIQLVDMDGSGPTDILYLGPKHVTCWLNQAGNSFSEPVVITDLPDMSELSKVSVVDFLGIGTPCIVWSSSLPGHSAIPIHYIDLMGGRKPYLMTGMKNNLGAETRITYASSTKFYLQDRENGLPWITKLPFPVHVVEQVDSYDKISKSKFVTRYAYHHGYYDGAEREFRGFGMVEQWDTEEMEAMGHPDVSDNRDNYDASSYIPPILTKTWFHTGAYFEQSAISRCYLHEYYRNPLLSEEEWSATCLPDTQIPLLTTVQEEREACRALKGSLLHQEIYALDDSLKSSIPYSVSERSYSITCLQPVGENSHAIFSVYPAEMIDYQYDRNPDDPRISHSLNLARDRYGNVLLSAQVTYGRQKADPELPPEVQTQQQQTHITYVANKYTEDLDTPDSYRTPHICETSSYELTGFFKPYGRFSAELIRDSFYQAELISYEYLPDGSLQKRQIDCTRTLYRKNDLSGPLPFGKLESLALPYEVYLLVFTKDLFTQLYASRVSFDTVTNVGGYLRDDDENWWIPSGRTTYVHNEQNSFYLPAGFTDPFGNTNTVTYDTYQLVVEKTVDPLGNQVHSVIDYRVMQPKLVTDANGNRSSIVYDALGMVTGTANMGKETEQVGDSLEDFVPDLADTVIASLLENPVEHAHEILQKATTRFVYDVERYARTQHLEQPEPNVVLSILRETHQSELADGSLSAIQLQLVYSDGFGREIQKKLQAEAGRSDTLPREDNWIGSGWTIWNNKGKPVKKYEPFFSDSHKFEVNKTGVSSTLLYDPLERVIATLYPDHTYEKVVFDAWRVETWDRNDTLNPFVLYDPRNPDVLPSHQFNPADDPDVGSYLLRLPTEEYLPTWYDVRMDPIKVEVQWPDHDPVTGTPFPRNATFRESERLAAIHAAKHSSTPAVTYLDSLGRSYYSLANNGLNNEGVAQLFSTRSTFDIQGNVRSVIDAKARTIATYDYDMKGNKARIVSMDSGTRLELSSVTGKPIYQWDDRGHIIRYTYDQLQRPLATYVRELEKEKLVELIVYGEDHPDSKLEVDGRPKYGALNLRGKPFLQLDGAGAIVTMGLNPSSQVEQAFDFKGNLLTSHRRFVRNYKEQPDWSSVANVLRARDGGLDLAAIGHELEILLELEQHATSTGYDALNRVTEVITPDLKSVAPIYNKANLIKQIKVNMHDRPGSLEGIVDQIQYDAKGLPLLIHYGNGVSTTYSYDPKTYRLLDMRSNREASKLQDIHYTTDPVGNIASIHDFAQQTYYFDNQVIEPHSAYQYDPIYQLICATGRELIGLTDLPKTDWNSRQHISQLHPSDGAAMRNYRQKYHYDEVGNLLQMIHRANNANWSRTYTYDEASLIDSSDRNNRLSHTMFGSVKETYHYDEHGNMTSMPNVSQMLWNYEDQLRSVDLGGGGTAYYLYAGGQRVRKVIERLNGTKQKERLMLGSFEIYREFAGDGATISLERETLSITNGQKRIALIETRTKGTDTSPAELIRYQLTNYLDSVSFELDQDGMIISYEEFYPFGSTSYQFVPNDREVPPKRYRFTGKERDEESGLFDYGARYYIPWLGRWTQADPLGLTDGVNVYAYVHNNPVNATDPTGTETVEKMIDKIEDPTEWFVAKTSYDLLNVFSLGTLSQVEQQDNLGTLEGVGEGAFTGVKNLTNMLTFGLQNNIYETQMREGAGLESIGKGILKTGTDMLPIEEANTLANPDASEADRWRAGAMAVSKTAGLFAMGLGFKSSVPEAKVPNTGGSPKTGKLLLATKMNKGVSHSIVGIETEVGTNWFHKVIAAGEKPQLTINGQEIYLKGKGLVVTSERPNPQYAISEHVVPLENANNALKAAVDMMGESNYNIVTKSCINTACNILSAGGLTTPAITPTISKFLFEMGITKTQLAQGAMAGMVTTGVNTQVKNQ